MKITQADGVIMIDDRRIIIPDEGNYAGEAAFRRAIYEHRWRPALNGLMSYEILTEPLLLVWDAAERKVAYDKDNRFYQRDKLGATDRFFVGLAFEMLIHQIYHKNLEQFDTSAHPPKHNRKLHDFNDLTIDGVKYPRIGSKCCKKGFCPMVLAKSEYPEIIGYYKEIGNRAPGTRPPPGHRIQARIVGIASRDDMNRYGHKLLVANAQARTQKHGFYGPVSPALQLQPK